MSELLPKVEVWRITDQVALALHELVKDAVRKVLEEEGLRRAPVQPEALRINEAARYVGVGRSTFYKLMKEDDHHLMSTSFTAGRCRMWTKAALDEWMARKSGSSNSGHLLPAIAIAATPTTKRPRR